MTPTQEELKILAEWLYKEDPLHVFNPPNSIEVFNKNDVYVDSLVFQPHLDSNQLDLLEDKMTKELGRLEMQLLSDGVMKMSYCFHSYIQDGFYKEIRAEGKTKNEARLNAILTYVKGLK